MKKIIIIVGMTKDHVIGKDNDLPWHISEDLKLFKKLTKNNIVVMGRKTYESIGKALPRRTNIVISRSERNYEKTHWVDSLENAIIKSEEFDGDVFIIGGGTIYNQALEIATHLSISWVKKDYEGDTFFPQVNWDDWKREETKDYDEFQRIFYSRNPKT